VQDAAIGNPDVASALSAGALVNADFCGYLNVFRPDCVLFDITPGGRLDASCDTRARLHRRKDESSTFT
jgi:hypothetical protein